MDKIYYLSLVILILVSGCNNSSISRRKENAPECMYAGRIEKGYKLIAHRRGVTDDRKFQDYCGYSVGELLELMR